MRRRGPNFTMSSSALGAACRTARDGEEAWALFELVRPDVVLAAWFLPRLDGIELVRKIRGRQGPPVHVVLLASHCDANVVVEGIDAGADDVRREPIDVNELRARLGAINRSTLLYKELEAKCARASNESRRAFELARIDALTGIGNRLHLEEDLKVAWSLAIRYGRRFSGALFDVDWFKSYNDRFGHVAGDELLQRVTERLREGLRRGDSIYRYGGEEFLVLFPEQSVGEALIASERLRASVENLSIPTPTELGVVTVSGGVAELSIQRDRGVGDWVERIDRALYRAKTLGRAVVDADLATAPYTSRRGTGTA